MNPSVIVPDRSLRIHWLTHFWIWFLLVLLPTAIVALIVPPLASLILALVALFWIVAGILTALWIPAYISRLEYRIEPDVLRGSMGVFWRRNATIPYAKITNVDIRQGPLQRRFGIGTVNIQTAGFGGAQGAVAELQLYGIRDLTGTRDLITAYTMLTPASPRKRAPGLTELDLLSAMAKELTQIRKALMKKS